VDLEIGFLGMGTKNVEGQSARKKQGGKVGGLRTIRRSASGIVNQSVANQGGGWVAGG